MNIIVSEQLVNKQENINTIIIIFLYILPGKIVPFSNSENVTQNTIV
jgi:hypothetical protein